jgi:hypothetical protein
MEWEKEESARQEDNAISGAPTDPESSAQMQRDAWDYNCAHPWL